jgi:hypothetical protein
MEYFHTEFQEDSQDIHLNSVSYYHQSSPTMVFVHDPQQQLYRIV